MLTTEERTINYIVLYYNYECLLIKRVKKMEMVMQLTKDLYLQHIIFKKQ
jgi:hypothetical protein